LPEADHVFQAAEDAGQQGHERGVQRIGQPERGAAFLGIVAHAGDLVGQGGLQN